MADEKETQNSAESKTDAKAAEARAEKPAESKVEKSAEKAAEKSAGSQAEKKAGDSGQAGSAPAAGAARKTGATSKNGDAEKPPERGAGGAEGEKKRPAAEAQPRRIRGRGLPGGGPTAGPGRGGRGPGRGGPGRGGGRRDGGRGRARGRGGDDEGSGLEERVIKINRCATVVKGGRRFSFSALVIVGDRKGKVGVGFGKANEVPPTVEKAVIDGRKNFFEVPLVNGTIPHEVKGVYRGSRVVLLPAQPGTGVIAGATVRAIVECAGVQNILTKSFGSNNPINLAKATASALQQLRSREEIMRLRGVSS